MNTRVKIARKELGLTQMEFATRLGFSSKGTISALESGQREITDRVVKQICKEFNVNERWLRTGEGNMFNEVLSKVVEQLADEYGLNELEKILIMEYGRLKEEQKEVFRQYFAKVLKSLSSVDETAIAVEHDDGIDIEKELEDYRRELELEKKRRKLSAIRA